jgi:hypothetical protein
VHARVRKPFLRDFSGFSCQILLAGVAPSLLYSTGRSIVDPKEDYAMTRGIFGALAAVAAATLLATSAAQAASPLTLKCVRKEATDLRTCITSCRNTFRAERAACYGPGLQCALTCTSATDACLAPVTAALDACNGNCAGAQRDTIDICRSQFQNGLITEAQLEQCANNARLTSLECRLACTGDQDEERLACNTAQAACLAACASCGTPQQCPAS